MSSDLLSQEGTLLSRWFPEATKQEVEKDVVGLGRYERTLTVLITDAAPEEDEESGDSYIELWKEGLFCPNR